MDNQQVLINELPNGKLSEDNYKLSDAPMPVAEAGQVVVKTKAFAITAGARAGLQGSASYAGAPTTGIVMNGTGIGEVVESQSEDVPVGSGVRFDWLASIRGAGGRIGDVDSS